VRMSYCSVIGHNSCSFGPPDRIRINKLNTETAPLYHPGAKPHRRESCQTRSGSSRKARPPFDLCGTSQERRRRESCQTRSGSSRKHRPPFDLCGTSQKRRRRESCQTRSGSSRKARPPFDLCGTSQERRRRESYQPGAEPQEFHRRRSPRAEGPLHSYRQETRSRPHGPARGNKVMSAL